MLSAGQVMLGAGQVMLGAGQVMLGAGQVMLGAGQEMLGAGQVKMLKSVMFSSCFLPYRMISRTSNNVYAPQKGKHIVATLSVRLSGSLPANYSWDLSETWYIDGLQ